jgi:hypothetical protein
MKNNKPGKNKTHNAPASFVVQKPVKIPPPSPPSM